MAACELQRNYTTRFCLFAIDSESDLDMLPTAERVGSGDLISSTYCCIGSRARGSDGTQYVLNGSNQWIVYNGGSGGGGGGDYGPGPEDAEEITDADLEALFGN